MSKQYFIFSDVHGEYNGLIKALENKGFEYDNPEHILLSLGDNFDRGSQNYSVAKFLIKYWKLDRFIGIMGNHDEFYDDFIKNNSDFNIIYNGFGQTLRNWSGISDISDYEIRTERIKILKAIDDRLPELNDFIDSFVDKVELGKYVFTHAGYSKDVSFIDRKLWYLNNWSKTPEFIKYFNPKDKIYVFGHYGAKLLNETFFPNEQKEIDDIFISEDGHFIGIDATSILTKKVNVLVYDEEKGELV